MSRSNSKDSVRQTPPLTFSSLKINTNINFHYVALEFFSIIDPLLSVSGARTTGHTHPGWGRGDYGQGEGRTTTGQEEIFLGHRYVHYLDWVIYLCQNSSNFRL